MDRSPLDRYEQRQFTPPPGAVDLLLVRHGASQAHVPGAAVDSLQGQDDPPLAPAGEDQARRLADRLAPAGVDRIFVTSLRRTQQTAAPLAQRLGHEPVVIPELREIGLGEWEQGVYREKMHVRHPLAVRMWVDERWDVIPGAERDEDFSARVEAGIARVIEACEPDERAVVVVHGGVIAELCRVVAGSRKFAFLGADNTSISRVVVLPDGRRILRGYNDVAHLA